MTSAIGIEAKCRSPRYASLCRKLHPPDFEWVAGCDLGLASLGRPLKSRIVSSSRLGFLGLGHTGGDSIEGPVGRQGCALLPAYDVTGVVAGHKDAALRLDPELVARRGAGFEVADPGSQVVGNVSPADVDGVLQLLRAAGMQEFNGLSRGLPVLPAGRAACRILSRFLFRIHPG